MSMFFLMCSERSGSNFITKLLNGHENICGPSTKHLINPVARNLFRYGDLTDEKNWNELLVDIHRLFSVDFSVWKSEQDFNTMKELASSGDIAGLIRNLFLEEAKAHGKQHVFIKENHVYEFFPFLQAHFPEARYVYLIRDPRDMALSWKKNRDHPGGVVTAARQWRQDQVQNMKNYHLLAADKRAYHLCYEDLIVNTQPQCKAIFSILGVPFDEKIRDFYKDEYTQKNAGQVDAWNNLSKPVLTDNSKKYKAEMAEEEIAAIESICFYEMIYFGYTPELVTEEAEWLTQEHLQKMEDEEKASSPRDPTESVIANMHAKRAFYEHQPGKK